jgi:2-polyprenyl-3-methyl-5-hydroxy-6-metoxy-1,4-benzoquinol methylase
MNAPALNFADRLHAALERAWLLKPTGSAAAGACIACGGPARLTTAPRFDSSIMVCAACGHESLFPMPSPRQIADYYTGYPTTDVPRERLDHLIALHCGGIEKLARLSGRSPGELRGKRMLDYGFGGATSSFAAQMLGIDVVGIDFDVNNVRRAREFSSLIGVPVDFRQGSFDAIDEAGGPYDIVHAGQLIEHLPDPNVFLATVARNQRAGGLLWLCLPNNRALFLIAKNLLRGRYERENFFNALKLVEHLHGFTRRSLAILARRHGYRIVECADYSLRDVAFQPENAVWYLGLGKMLLRILGHRGVYNVQKAAIASFDHAAHTCLSGGAGLLLVAIRD